MKKNSEFCERMKLLVLLNKSWKSFANFRKIKQNGFKYACPDSHLMSACKQ